MASVTSVLKEVLPPNYDGVDEATLDNARDRGNQVDSLITAYVMGNLTEYPIGTRHDSMDLFEKFQSWWDKQRFTNVAAQQIVSDHEVAGAMDLRGDSTIFDVKCTSRLLPSHRIQVAGYVDLDRQGCNGALIHLTKRNKTAKIEEMTDQNFRDWMTVREFWSLKRRLSA